MMTNYFHDVVPEHEGTCVAFFTDGIILKPISNYIVYYSKLIFVVPLEHNCMFVYVKILPSITAPLEVVSNINHKL